MAVRKRKGSPYWFYDFTIGGRRYRGTTGKETKSEALTVEAEIRRQAAQAKVVENDWRMRHLTGTYLKNVVIGSASEPTLTYQIYNLLDGLGADTRIIELTNAAISTYISKRRAKVSNSSVNRELTLLHAMLNYAHEAWDQAIPKINWKKLWLKEPPPRDRFLSRDEYEALLAAAHPDIRPIIIFAVGTGLRKGNILSLDWAQIDLNARVVRVRIKGDKRHVVELRGDAVTVLAAMPHRRGLVFATTNFRRKWEAAVKAAKLTDFRFHDLRHTFAAWARLAGADLLDIKEALGHSDISMSARYAHIKPGMKKSAFDLVSAQNTAQLAVSD